ncbi:MAG: DNA/RNA non-specific endonuclease [Polyangiales bacterium]
MAKEQNGRKWSVASDHLGTPTEMYDELGQLAWKMQLDVFGVPSVEEGAAQDCPWRWPGQYEDAETGDYYNRWRYYSTSSTGYLRSDPIQLFGGPSLYSYVADPNRLADPTGLAPEVLYHAPDSLGRPTGLTALVTPQDLGTGTAANGSIRPPGWEGGLHPHHHNRAHLLGNALGGSGDEPRNLITMTSGSNHPHMYVPEAAVADHVRAGNFANVEVTVHYHGDSPLDYFIRYRATDLATLATGNSIVDAIIPNGLTKNHACCA